MTALVIALGQTLRRDDGAAAALLGTVPLPAACRLLVLPQLLPELADDLARADRVLFVDAALDQAEPLLESVAAAAGPRAFTHAATPGGLLELCRRLHGTQPVAYALRLPAFDLGFGEGLSEALQAQLPKARALLVQWLHDS